MGNWDEFVRAGAWDVGGGPPMALGVEAAGTVLATRDRVRGWAPGDAVMTHPVPLRDQGTWAPRLAATPSEPSPSHPDRGVSRSVAFARTTRMDGVQPG